MTCLKQLAALRLWVQSSRGVDKRDIHAPAQQGTTTLMWERRESCEKQHSSLPRPPRSQPKEDKVALEHQNPISIKWLRAVWRRDGGQRSNQRHAEECNAAWWSVVLANLRKLIARQLLWEADDFVPSYTQPIRRTTSPRRTKEWVPQTSTTSSDHTGYGACAVNNSCSLILHA